VSGCCSLRSQLRSVGGSPTPCPPTRAGALLAFRSTRPCWPSICGVIWFCGVLVVSGCCLRCRQYWRWLGGAVPPGPLSPWRGCARSGIPNQIRPPASNINALKWAWMRTYGETGSPANFEEDHPISFELGGAPRGPRSFWPELHLSPTEKDSVEGAAHDAVRSVQILSAYRLRNQGRDGYRVIAWMCRFVCP
jgi:hypothetical protein